MRHELDLVRVVGPRQREAHRRDRADRRRRQRLGAGTRICLLIAAAAFLAVPGRALFSLVFPGAPTAAAQHHGARTNG